MSENSAPNAPTASRIQPIVWISMPLTVALTAQTRTAPTATRRRLTPIPMFCLLSMDNERNFVSTRENAETRCEDTGDGTAAESARPSVPPDPGSRPRIPRGSTCVPSGPRDAHAHARLRAAQPVRGLPRGAVRRRQPRVRLLAGHEVPVVLPARRTAGRPRATRAQREVDPLHRRDPRARGSDLSRRARADGTGRDLGFVPLAPGQCGPFDARRPADRAEHQADSFEVVALTARPLRRDRQPQPS